MIEQSGFSGRRFKRFAPAVAAVTLAAATVALTGQAGATTNPRGSACAYRANLSLFGSPTGSEGCPPQTSGYATVNSLSPSVTLPAGGTTGVVSAVDSNGAQAYWGAYDAFGAPSPSALYTPEGPSGSLSVSTKGTTTVTSQATANTVGLIGKQGWNRSVHKTQFNADSVSSTCTARATSHTLSSTIQNAVVVTSTDDVGLPLTTFSVPGSWTPPVNYTVHGTVNNAGDSFDIVFNEHISNADGSFTVNAAHMYLSGSFENGDIFVSQTMCGA